MKIGILTFYRGLNYGAILQAFALQEYLRKMGHHAVIIRHDPEGNLQRRFFVRRIGDFLVGYLRIAVGALKDSGRIGTIVRSRRTRQFCRTMLALSDENLTNWTVFKSIFSYDLVIVGSDQVWHASRDVPPLLYLLEGIPDGVNAASYAASFGMKVIPSAIQHFYAEGFKRFKAISVREKIGLSLVESCGATSTHVVDPTILVGRALWDSLVSTGGADNNKKKLVCYFLTEDVDATWDLLAHFAKRMGCVVHVLLDGSFGRQKRNSLWRAIVRGIKMMTGKTPSICIRFDVGPEEFVNEIATAQWVCTDSFHGSVFSYLYDVDARIIAPPRNHWRAQMFDRLREFADDISSGNMIVPDLSAALDDFSQGRRISYSKKVMDDRRERSVAFVERCLKMASHE